LEKSSYRKGLLNGRVLTEKAITVPALFVEPFKEVSSIFKFCLYFGLRFGKGNCQLIDYMFLKYFFKAVKTFKICNLFCQPFLRQNR